jgi:hypothetical protein
MSNTILRQVVSGDDAKQQLLVLIRVAILLGSGYRTGFGGYLT